MDEEQAKRLGAFLRARREELGWSSRRLAAECEMNDATIVRIENGQSAATWRKRDKSYRDQEKKRRAANARKREAAAQGMTVAELEERLTVDELAEWGALFEVEAEEHKKAMKDAEAKSKRRR